MKKFLKTKILNFLIKIFLYQKKVIFEEIKKRTLYSWKIYISYLEIYNNDGYDLLYENNNFNDPSKRYELENLPRVRIRE